MKMLEVVKMMSRKEKMSFLMNNKLHDINDLIIMDEETLNDFVVARIKATGFELRTNNN